MSDEKKSPIHWLILAGIALVLVLGIWTACTRDAHAAETGAGCCADSTYNVAECQQCVDSGQCTTDDGSIWLYSITEQINESAQCCTTHCPICGCDVVGQCDVCVGAPLEYAVKDYGHGRAIARPCWPLADQVRLLTPPGSQGVLYLDGGYISCDIIATNVERLHEEPDGLAWANAFALRQGVWWLPGVIDEPDPTCEQQGGGGVHDLEEPQFCVDETEPVGSACSSEEECGEALNDLCEGAGHGGVKWDTVKIYDHENDDCQTCIGECKENGAVPFVECCPG